MGAESAMDTLRHHGKSFFWASLFLPPRLRQGAARLYAYCRELDDYADDLPPAEARQRLGRILEGLEQGAEGDHWGREMAALEREFGVPRRAMLRLIRSLIADTQPRSFHTREALLCYAYGVAGTVGLMMRPLLGAWDPRALPHAVDLGIAMQLTNIARDVLEDAQRDRRYLPLGDAQATPEALLAAEPGVREGAWQEIDALLDLADAYYRSADCGMAFIPLRSRIAIAAAARIYEGIGAEIRRLGPAGYWQQRARVGLAGKVRHSLRGLYHALRVQPPGHHEARLHRAFAPLLTEDGGTERG